MFQTNVGSSINPDVLKAGAEAAAAAKAGLDDIKLAFVYSGVQYDQKLLLDSVASELPGVPLVGNTSFTGVITPAGFVGGDDGFVGVFAVAGDGLTVGTAGSPKGESARATGRDVAKAALAAAGKPAEGKIVPPDYFYMTANPGEEEFFLKGIEDVIGRVPIFGGSAADNAIAGEWSLFTSDMVTAEGVAVAFFWDKAAGGFTNLFTGAYAETDQYGVITKVRNNRELVEIDGVPAVKKYAEWRGIDDMESLSGGNLLVTTITNPLGVKDRLGDLVAIRHPMNGNDDLSMAIGANLTEKTTVIMMDGDVDTLVRSAGETVERLLEKAGRKPAGLHLVHCGGRRAGIADRIGEVYAGRKSAAGDIPFIVEFTFGEYGFEDDGNNTTGGLMLSYTALG
ncbi:MAG: FIST C-terminal domain-containing protein [Clostridiales Family XIII bacterium]|nr:FIST C-terminal domain-containing protein [Clostridiales Family XIII bacterium]